jgi:hypothetical protein
VTAITGPSYGGAEKLNFVMPLLKIDAANQLIYARAAQEIPDKSGEIMDYASAVKDIQRWSSEYESRTNGLSKGNVRVMHQKNACGVVKDILYNDDDKAIDVCMKIVDPLEFAKAEAGVYTGVSVGGGYLRKWTDSSGAKRYTPFTREFSLVDDPCIPTATFAELVKLNGETEQLRLVGRAHSFNELWKIADAPDETPTFDRLWAARAKTFDELWGA